MGWRIKSISSCAQYVTLRKYFSHPRLVKYSFATPPHKTETRTAYSWGDSKEITWTNHYDGPIRNTEQQVEHVHTLYSVRALHCYYAFYQPRNYAEHAIMPSTQLCRARNYAEPKPTYLGFLHPILLSRVTYWAKTDLPWLSSSNFYCPGSHTEQRWRCSNIL
jgi:hypothetical protein